MTQPETNAQTVEERGAPIGHATHRLENDQLLPPICPLCAAPGTTARAVPRPFQARWSTSSSALEAHFCDLCAQNLQDQTTRQVAVLATSTILSVALVTASALHWGTRWLALQLLLGVSSALLIPFLFRRVGQPARAGIEEIKGENQARQIVIESQIVSRAFVELGIPKFSNSTQNSSTTGLSLAVWTPSLGSALFCAVWWLTIHSLGNATVRVVHAGDQTAVFLVDDRHEGTVAATNSEDPQAGRFVSVLGGRRSLRLVQSDGTALLNESLTVWPGTTYIVGHLPTSKCFYLEERSYGTSTNTTLRALQGKSEHLWQLKQPIDSWFQPLPPNRGERTTENSLETSGGKRRAIRLLPCQ